MAAGVRWPSGAQLCSGHRTLAAEALLSTAGTPQWKEAPPRVSVRQSSAQLRPPRCPEAALLSEFNRRAGNAKTYVSRDQPYGFHSPLVPHH